MQDMWVWSLGQEDPLEEGMANHSSILAWETPRTEGPLELQFISLQSWTQWKWLSTPVSVYNVILHVCFLSQNPWTNQESSVKHQAASISSKCPSLEPVSGLSYFNQQPIIFQKLYLVSEMGFY